MEISATGLTRPAQNCDALHSSARAIEASFIEEMLKQAQLNRTPESFSGGAGEEQFASFLNREMAADMTAAGGIGLAEQVFAHLAKGSDCGF